MTCTVYTGIRKIHVDLYIVYELLHYKYIYRYIDYNVYPVRYIPEFEKIHVDLYIVYE